LTAAFEVIDKLMVLLAESYEEYTVSEDHYRNRRSLSESD